MWKAWLRPPLARAIHLIYEIVETMKQTAATTHDLNQLSEFFITTFPRMDRSEQALARAIYQQLALGEPLSLERLGEVLHQAVNTLKETLARWGGIFYNDDGAIIGFWGIAVEAMRHRMQFNGKTSYAWCALDTLFIPELVGSTAEVSSTSATTDKPITLTVTPQGIDSEQTDTWVSFLLPDEKAVEEDVTTSFCHFVYFFQSRAAGETWIAKHPGTFLLSIDEAFKVGKKVNAARYRDVL